MSADGIPNLLRYALNLNSQTSGAAGLPKVQTVSSNGNSYLTLSYTQVMAATDIVYTVEVSGDLHTWNSGGGYTSIINATNNADGVTQTVTVQDLTPINIATQRFLRLKVTKP